MTAPEGATITSQATGSQPLPGATPALGARWRRRLIQLYAGLVLYGVSMALMIRAGFGLDPWDVFHQGLATRTGWSFGVTTMVVGAAVLLLWIPLRQWPGIGTVSNVVVIGLSVDAALAVLAAPGALAARAALLAAGVVLNCIEITVLAVGWLLGGTVGVATVAYALAIGPLVHLFLPLLTVPGVTAGGDSLAP